MTKTKLDIIMKGCEQIKEDSNKKLIGYREDIRNLENAITFERGKLLVIEEMEYLYNKE